MGIDVSNLWLDDAAKNLLCKKGSVTFTYFGFPIRGSSSTVATRDPIIQKMEKKLAMWRGRLLSIRGRVTCIKSSLSNLPLYYMSLYPIPQEVIN